MTTIETALIGLATAFFATVVLPVRRRSLSMGVIVALVTVAYFALAPEVGHRQVLALVITLAFGAQATYWLHWLRFAQESAESPLASRRPPLIKTTFLAFLAAAPVLLVMSEPDASWSFFDGLALASFGLGAYFVEVSLRQRRRFVAANGEGGRVLDKGLWGLTRQPHFFGICLVSCSFFVLALATPNGLLTLFSPLVLTRYFRDALDVQGAELAMMRDAPEYRDYAQSTPAFFPRLKARKG